MMWRIGTVVELIEETERACSIIVDVPGGADHAPGQYLDIRLAAAHSHGVRRSCWIASAPEDGYLALTVQRLTDAHASPYLVDELRVGETVELSAPMGESFTWDDALTDPVLLIAGGAGVVPVRAMLRHWFAGDGRVPLRLLYSARSLSDVIYHDELMRYAAYDEVEIRFTLTRTWPRGWRGHRGRLDQALLEEIAWPPADQPMNYVCGPSGFVEAAASALVDIGHSCARIKAERCGPSASRRAR
jgi:ferredoxin-NADP reductase